MLHDTNTPSGPDRRYSIAVEASVEDAITKFGAADKFRWDYSYGFVPMNDTVQFMIIFVMYLPSLLAPFDDIVNVLFLPDLASLSNQQQCEEVVQRSIQALRTQRTDQIMSGNGAPKLS